MKHGHCHQESFSQWNILTSEEEIAFQCDEYCGGISIRGPGSPQEASHPILDASWIKELGWGNLARNSWLGGEFQVVQRPRDTKYIKLHAKIFIVFYVALSFLRPAVGMIAFVFVLCITFYVITSIIVSKIVLSIFLGVAFVIHSFKWLHIPSLLIIIRIYLNFEWS